MLSIDELRKENQKRIDELRKEIQKRIDAQEPGIAVGEHSNFNVAVELEEILDKLGPPVAEPAAEIQFEVDVVGREVVLRFDRPLLALYLSKAGTLEMIQALQEHVDQIMDEVQ